MDKHESACSHLNQIEDYHEGNIVCTSCGLVLSSLYLSQVNSTSYEEFSNNNNNNNNFNNNNNNEILLEIQNLLDRIHVPTCYGHKIESYYKKNFTTKSTKGLVFSIYKNLNDMGIPVSMKEISNVANVSKSLLNKVQCDNNCVELNPSTLVDKYCTMLGLSFTIATLIKRNIELAPASGHNPNSVVASTIYQVCKKNKLKISIKKISQVTSVSCISIQRYNNFSKTCL